MSTDRAETPRSCPKCFSNNESEVLERCYRVTHPWHDAAPAAPTPQEPIVSHEPYANPLLNLLARANYYMQSDNDFTTGEWDDYADVKQKIASVLSIEDQGYTTPQEHHKPCGSPTCVACSVKHVPLPYPHSSVIYTDLSVRCGFCKQRACWRYEVESDEIVFTHECVPSAPVKEPQMPVLGFCQRGLDTSTFHVFPHPGTEFCINWQPAEPSAPVERIETMPMKPREEAGKKPCSHINKAGHEWETWCMDCGERWPNNLHLPPFTAAPSGAEEATPTLLPGDWLLAHPDYEKWQRSSTSPISGLDDIVFRWRDVVVFMQEWAKLKAGAALPVPEPPSAIDLARRFHTIYESLAPNFGYETRKESAKPWSQVPAQNQNLMIAVCEKIIAEYFAEAVPEPRPETPREPVMMVDPLAPDEPHELSPDCRQYGCKPAGELKERGEQ